MPRVYCPKPEGKRYKKTDLEKVTKAKGDVVSGKLSIRKAAKMYNIPYTVLNRHIKNPNVKHQGGQLSLSFEEEEMLVERIKICAEWGYPIDLFDLRCLVKAYLDRRGITINKFRNNLPGKDFAESFMKRHRDEISLRLCQNIKRCRAAVSHEVINTFFDHLEESLHGVLPSNIVNFDETNLRDDPGIKKVIIKRGCKYPERILNSSKSSTSIMYAAAADGTVLPPYVVYKSAHVYDSWRRGGPKNARFNRSKSGWFDSACFDDWVENVAVPYLCKLNGKKILLGDNLSSHLSAHAIKLCKDNGISFVFLPKNSTHLTQPLDVAFFRPLKGAWRDILLKWKAGPGRKEVSVPKDVFPRLLSKLHDTVAITSSTNVMSGFAKAGIFPTDRNQVLKRLPNLSQAEVQSGPCASTSQESMDVSFVDFLKEMRFSDAPKPRPSRKKLHVEAGKSVEVLPDSHEEEEEEDNDLVQACRSSGNEEHDIRDEESSSEEGSQSTASIPDQCVKKFGKSIPNVHCISKGLVNIGDWLLVGFPTTGLRQKFQLFIGQVEEVFTEDYFEGKFLRPKATRDSSGYVYVFPDVADISRFSYEQVFGRCDPPEQFRRGQLKFKINSKYFM